MNANEQNNTSTQVKEESSCCSSSSCCGPETPVMRTSPKIGRNDPCVCGSGVKFKKCCGKG